MPTEPKRSGPTLLERAGEAASGVGSIGAGNPRRQALVRRVVIGLVLAFIAFFVISQWGQFPEHDWRFSPGWLAVSVLALASFYVITAELWRLILRRLGGEIGQLDAFDIYAKSLVARYVPTSVLLVVGRVVLAERVGVNKRTTLASLVYEVGCSVSAAVMIGAYFAITLPPLEDQPARWAILAVIPLALIALHPRVFHPLADFALRKLGRPPLPASLPFGQVLGFVLAYIVSWAVIGLGLFAFAAMLYPVDAGDLPYIASSVPVGFCVAVLTFVIPAGLGTRDATLAAAMDVVLPRTVAIGVAVGFRLFQTAVELLFVAIVGLLARRRRATSVLSSDR